VVVAIAGPLLISGCKVGPDYHRPDAAVNGAWSEMGAGAVNVLWWETLNDSTLTALVQAGLKQNLNLRTAGLRVLEARAARGVAVGQFFPQLQEATGSLGASQISVNDAAAAGDRSFSTDAIGIQAAWELDFWGKFRRGIEAADAEVLQSVADYDTVLVSLAADIATDYILICSLEERLVFARANVTLQSETLQLTQARFRAGAVSELDVSTARATLANTQSLIPDLENSLRQTKLALCILLGRTPSELETELGAAATGAGLVPEPPPQIAAGVPAELLRRRPDVRSAERFAAAQSARIGQAVANLYPQISITGSTGFVSSTFEGARRPNLGNIFDANSFAGFIGLQVNWPFLNYGRIQGNIRVQDARYEQAVAQYQQSVLQAASEVEAGLSEFLRSKERTTFLTEAVDASKRSVELSLIQYRAGAVDFIRVNEAQTTLVQQEDSMVVARAAITLGAVRTYRALGGGWEVREGHEFVDPQTADRMRNTTNWGDVLKPDWQDGRDLGFPRPASPDSTGGGK
jgi:NodT family efflux transporter outer membrane factor (OMF) lipoprotein